VSESAAFPLVVERLGERLRERYERPTGPEGFEGPRSMEDLPLYEWTRRILRAGTRLKGRTFPRRMMEQPAGLDAGLEHKTPQFFLRNVSRTEHSLEDRPEFEMVATRDHEDEARVADLLRMRYRPPSMLQKWNIEEVVRVRRMFRRLLFADDWTRHFGRELKERIQGPLFKYDPDAGDGKP